MVKYDYTLIINNGHTVAKPLATSYGRTNGILLHICRDGILITAGLNSKQEADTILHGQNPLFLDALRKSLLLYTVIYNADSQEIAVAPSEDSP